MKDIHNKILYYFLSLLIVLINNVYSQETHSYNIDPKLDIEKNIIEVEQSIKFKNISNKNLTEIYLEDWSNSFMNNETNLASRITDELSVTTTRLEDLISGRMLPPITTFISGSSFWANSFSPISFRGCGLITNFL